MKTILPLIDIFRPAFGAPTFRNFCFLVLTWLQNTSRTSISNFVRAGRFLAPELIPKRAGKAKHFSVFYRVFTRAKWSLDELGRLLAHALENWLSEQITVIVDDTLTRRTGPFILGAAMHHDPLRGNQMGGKNRRTEFSFGLNFVILALWVPLGCVRSGGIAVPVLFRLYRSRSTTPPEYCKSRSVLAAELVALVRRWWPNRSILVVVDHEYASKNLLESFDEKMDMVAPLPKNAALHSCEVIQSGRGRKRIWGERLASPEQLAADDQVPWQELEVILYGRTVTLLIKTMQARWKSAPSTRDLTVVITRDPSGRYQDRVFFRMRAQAEVQDVLTPVCQRWSIEVAIRDSKQHLGIEEPQNGFLRRRVRSTTKTAGPQAPAHRRPTASERTVPLGMLCYSIVVLWYLRYGQPRQDVMWARYLAPWYRHKRTISFGDMLGAFRRQMELEHLWKPRPLGGFVKIVEPHRAPSALAHRNQLAELP
jgi:hypothetical protein